MVGDVQHDVSGRNRHNLDQSLTLYFLSGPSFLYSENTLIRATVTRRVAFNIPFVPMRGTN